MDTKIRKDDLGGIDFLNGSSNIVSNTKLGLNNLKGSLAKYNNGFNTKNIDKERRFLLNMKNRIVEFQIEQFEYSGLPEGLNKYRLEQKLMENGLVGIVKVGNTFFVLNSQMEDYNVYDEPTKLKILEPKSTLDNKTLEVGTEIAFIRNNLAQIPTWFKVINLVELLGKTLDEIDANLLLSKPKGLINQSGLELDIDTDNGIAKSWETVLNGEKVIITYTDTTKNASLGQDKEPFKPVELKDRTIELWETYLKTKEEIKELIGAGLTIDKKERNISSEVDKQQDLSKYSLDHMKNIRNSDLELVNKMFGTNIQVKIIESDKGVDNETIHNKTEKPI